MIEKERKFLLKAWPESAKELGQIRQGYLMLTKDKQLRVRIYDSGEFGNQAFLCYKLKVTDTERLEYEYEIPLEDAEELFEASEKTLSKLRYYIEGSTNIVIDVYEDGLQVCEIEYDKALKKLPKFCGKEITGNKKYSNINLAK